MGIEPPKPERMDRGFIGSQGPKGTVVLEDVPINL
jgi:hypothetical protein